MSSLPFPRGAALALRPLHVAVLLACGFSNTAFSQGGATKAVELEQVVVTATRSEADADAVAATITSQSRKELDRRQPRDEADLFKDEPDVAFARDMRRFGSTRVNIRGVEDNRVVQMVDGVRLEDYRNGGGPTNFTMASALGTPIDFLKRVEVLRGPASSLYGSDALGGVVGYFTLGPRDLATGDKTEAYRLKASYNGANEGTTLTGLAAWRGEVVDALIGVSGTRAHETGNFGKVGGYSPLRTEPNPADNRDFGLLAKLVVRPVSGHEIKLALEHRDQDTDVDVLRRARSLARVASMQGDDNARRNRLSADWAISNPTALYDLAKVKVFYQKGETANYNQQTRTPTGATCSAVSGAGNTCYIEQDFLLEQKSYGTNIQLDKALSLLGTDHWLIYGMDYSFSRVEEYRENRVWNLTTNTFTQTLSGDASPLRDFPIGETRNLGVFFQDQISLDGGRLTLTPGLRYDKRKLEPKIDALSQAVLTANGQEAISQKHSAWSPKLSALWKVDDVYSLWGQIVKGFRAPNYEEVNGNFRNSTQSYATIPNPGLKPETSVGVEIGLRWAAQNVRGQFALFDNNYKNYIESISLSCPADPRCVAGLASTSLTANLRKVNIHGAELRSSWNFAPRWRVDGALAYVVGTDKDAHEPLNSVDPVRLSLGLAYDASVWGVESRMRAAARKSRISDWKSPNDSTVIDDDSTNNTTWYRPGGYAVFDVASWWQVSKQVRATLGVNNLFDKKYWLWSDIRQADARRPQGVDFYTQPGRHLVASVQVDF